jgi:electron transport complex protein RnfC
MLIGRAVGNDGSNVHSPVPGVVKSLGTITLPWGESSPAVFIELGGEFDCIGKPAQVYAWEEFRKDKLLALLAEKGLVGLGSGIPTERKLALSPGKRVKTLIINGMECEPYLCSDTRLLIEKTAEIMEGVHIAAKIVEPLRRIVAVPSDKKEALAAVKEHLRESCANIELMPLLPKYPLGDERQLVRAVTGEETVSGESVLDVGAVVLNVGTVFALYEAVVLQKPLIERSITIAGKAIGRQENLKVRIGTPLADLVEECGGFTQMPEKIVMGGPMMGWSIADLSCPVTKTTSGALFLTSREIRSSRRTNCLNCGRCIRSCPVGLNPVGLYKKVEHAAYAEACSEGILDCNECGCCAYACPARIPLVKEIRDGKLALASAAALDRGEGV